jgi:hypothetical protein
MDKNVPTEFLEDRKTFEIYQGQIFSLPPGPCLEQIEVGGYVRLGIYDPLVSGVHRVWLMVVACTGPRTWTGIAETDPFKGLEISFTAPLVHDFLS